MRESGHSPTRGRTNELGRGLAGDCGNAGTGNILGQTPRRTVVKSSKGYVWGEQSRGRPRSRRMKALRKGGGEKPGFGPGESGGKGISSPITKEGLRRSTEAGGGAKRKKSPSGVDSKKQKPSMGSKKCDTGRQEKNGGGERTREKTKGGGNAN